MPLNVRNMIAPFLFVLIDLILILIISNKRSAPMAGEIKSPRNKNNIGMATTLAATITQKKKPIL